MAAGRRPTASGAGIRETTGCWPFGSVTARPWGLRTPDTAAGTRRKMPWMFRECYVFGLRLRCSLSSGQSSKMGPSRAPIARTE